MTQKEIIAVIIGNFLEDLDWTVFEVARKCVHCKKKVGCAYGDGEAKFCIHCGEKMEREGETFASVVDDLYSAFLKGKKVEKALKRRICKKCNKRITATILDDNKLIQTCSCTKKCTKIYVSWEDKFNEPG